MQILNLHNNMYVNTKITWKHVNFVFAPHPPSKFKFFILYEENIETINANYIFIFYDIDTYTQ